MMDETVIRLQEMISHLEHDFSKLSAELYTQQKELAVLRQQVLSLQKKLEASADNTPLQTLTQEPPPPHY
jgi:uncharacterized coiled-coil protein SlyX